MSNTVNGIEYDQLTGLHSQWHLRMALQQILNDDVNRVFGVLDLDGFSSINEKYGTNKGDDLLQAIAQTLRLSYPDADLVHVAADEFAFILAPTNYSRYQMSLMTLNLYKNLHNIKVEGLDSHRLEFSIGTVFIDPHHHRSPDDILREASEFRLQAKKHEGNFLCSRYGFIPDVEGAFLILLDDRTLYNSINNRLFSLHNEQDWLDYLHEGAALKGSMYKRNQGHLDDILNYYSAGDLPDFDYELLFQLVTHYARSLDAFMFEMLVDGILLPYYEQCDQTSTKVRSRLGHLYLLMADSLISVARMGDQSQNRRVMEMLKKCREVTWGLPHDSIEFEPYFYALCETLGHYECFEQKLGDIIDCNSQYEMLRELLTSPDPFVVPNQEVYEYFEHLVNNARFFPFYRAAFLKLNERSLSDKEKEELDQRLDYIRQHLVDGVYDLAGTEPEYINLARYLQGILLNNLSYTKILERLELGLQNIKKVEYGTISSSNLIIVAYIFLGAARALVASELPNEQKREVGIRGLELLLDIVRKRESIATDPQMLFLVQVLIRSMLSSPMLTAADKYHYLERTLAAITLDTYAHSKAVAAYVRVILTNIIDNQPHLLAGSGRPYSSIDEVRANRENLLKFMDCACMLHDIGKINITPISSNAYRKLTDQEFRLIRKHPVDGVKMLRLEPAFDIFQPFIYTHHRWWNGEHGYPAKSRDEQQSPLQPLVYLLSFCDSLEAATSRIGRNYRSAKSFLQIMDEFYIEAGTRYSRDVLQSIISSPETYYDLRQMVDHKWQSIYQKIFQEVVMDYNHTQPPSPDATLPDPYAHSKQASVPMDASTKESMPVLPQWLLHMDKEQLQLYAFSLMERNMMSAQINDISIFLYLVKSDVMGILAPGPEGRIEHSFAQHFSENRPDQLLSPEGYADAMVHLDRAIKDPTFPRMGQLKLRGKDQSKMLLASYKCVTDSNDHVLCIVGQLEDWNTNRQHMLTTISRQNRYLEVLDSITNTFTVTVLTSVDFKEFEILHGFPALNEAAQHMTSTEQLNDYVQRNFVDLEYREDFAKFFDKNTLLERLKGQQKITFEYHTAVSGWLKAIIIPAACDHKSNVTHLLFFIKSINDEHQQKEELSYIAQYDALTGVYNRRTGEELIKKQIAQGGTQIFAIMDCDHFKRINDQLSHLVGDKVLRKQASVLSDFFTGDKVMRLGGDEFVVHINGEKANRIVNSFNGVKTLFQQLAERLATIKLPEMENIAPTMSCGVIFTDGSVDSITFDYLYQHADEALRESKKYRQGAITVSELRYREFYH